jgi:tetratricopeptide (TPR) repeat protein
MTWRWTILFSVVLALSFQARAVDRSELTPLPLPNLSTMEDATRRRLETLQERVTELENSGSDDALSEAYGTLGTYYIAHYQMDAAEVAFVNAERLNPSEFRWPYYLGFIYRKGGKPELERRAYERTIELRPEDIPARLHLAELCLVLGENEEGYRRFRRVLELSPTEAAAHGGLGKAAGALGRHEEAVEHYSEALRLQPQATIVHYQLALAYRRLGDMDAARAHLEQRGEREISFRDPLLSAIEPLKRENIVETVLEMAANPQEHDDRSFSMFAAAYLGDSPGAVDRIHEAIEALRRTAAGMDSSSERAARSRLLRARLHLAIASLLISQRDLGAARRELEASIAIVPETVVVNTMLGDVLDQTGNLSEAVERYSIALALDPGNINALRSRASVSLSLHRNREAIEDLERLCDLGLEGEGARIRLAAAYLRLGEHETARGHYRKALDLNLNLPDEAQVHHHLGIIEAQIGSVDRAIEEYRTALALYPGLIGARIDLGSALNQLGRYREAIELYSQVVKVDPKNSRARRGEAVALSSIGQWQEAHQLLEEGWRAMPESVELLHALARLLATADDPKVRNGERALDLAQRTLRSGTTPSRLETLAMASAAAGLFDDAVRLQRRVIRMMTWDGHLDALPRLEANLARYRAGQSCCAPSTDLLGTVGDETT